MIEKEKTMLQVLKSSLFLTFVAGTFLTVPSLAQPRDVSIKISAFGAARKGRDKQCGYFYPEAVH
jgi:hypothetical protein